MKSRAIIPLAIGLAVGVLAIKIFADVLQKAKGANTGETVQVVCAGTDISPTTEIKESMVEMKAVPKALVPALAFQSAGEVVGRVASLTIPRGLPVLPSLLAPKGTPPGMAVRIKDGYRAVAVKVDEFAGVAGWVRPGCLVDVVAVMQTTGSSAQRGTVSKVILEKVEVLAVGQDLGTSGETGAAVAKSVTILVHPEDVPMLHLATTKGTIRLAMRNQNDFTAGANKETTDKELLGEAPAANSAAPAMSSAAHSSILSRLFAKEPKIEAPETDKESEALPPATPVQVASAVPAEDHSWRVEVMAGSEVQEVWFDDSTADAQRIQGASDARKAGPLIQPTVNVRNIPSAGLRRAFQTGQVELSGPMESTE